MMKPVCIICSKEPHGGAPVADTKVIRAIRAIKRRLNIVANNRLMVCIGCMEEYKKRRKAFERKVLLYGAIGALLLALSVIMPLAGGANISIGSIFMVFLLAIFLLALAFLSYMPSLGASAQPHSDSPLQEAHGIIPLARANKLSAAHANNPTTHVSKPTLHANKLPAHAGKPPSAHANKLSAARAGIWGAKKSAKHKAKKR